MRRLPARGSYDRALIHSILDEALLCHVGFIADGKPFVIPTLHVRVGDRLYMHGSPGSRMLKAMAEGVEVCVTVTLVNGLVLARSAFHHSMNYRSAVVFGTARPVDDPEEKTRVLHALAEHLVAGRWRDVRGPAPGELKATSVLSLPIDEASAKVRTGPSAGRRGGLRAAGLGGRRAAIDQGRRAGPLPSAGARDRAAPLCPLLSGARGWLAG